MPPSGLAITFVGLAVYLVIDASYRLRGARPLEDREAEGVADDPNAAAQPT